MRAHGLPGFPDPNSQGIFSTTKANRSDFAGPQFQTANKACAHLQGPAMTAAQQKQTVGQFLRYAACMRAHGITNFPDPEVANNRISLSFGAGSGVDPGSPQFQSAQQACKRLMPRPGAGGL
jgi:hypothetical protein